VSGPATDRRVAVLGLGGTISMTADGSTTADGPGGVRPTLSVDELVSSVPGLADTAVGLHVRDVSRVAGASVSFADLHRVRAAIDECLAAGVDGVVVTQGTDTIEESAYVLDLQHAGAAPVVVTGAMRNPTMAGTDGPANLLAAVQVAASPACRDLGVLVVFADEIHAAARVRKSHTTSGHTFRSANGGPIGYVVEGQPRLVNLPAVRSARALSTLLPADRRGSGRDPEVAVLTVVLGDTGVLLDGIPDRVDGLVLAALGAGHVPEGLLDRLDALVGRMPVVLASRTGGGSILERTYGFPGSEVDLLGRGLISAGYLDALKARLLLRHLLAAGTGTEDIRAVFAALGG
jgi:L-asparaginase